LDGIGWDTLAMEPRITIVTLGVNNLQQSYDFYSKIDRFPSDKEIEGEIVFFSSPHKPGTLPKG